jgi:hypothetical protein
LEELELRGVWIASERRQQQQQQDDDDEESEEAEIGIIGLRRGSQT